MVWNGWNDMNNIKRSVESKATPNIILIEFLYITKIWWLWWWRRISHSHIARASSLLARVSCVFSCFFMMSAASLLARVFLPFLSDESHFFVAHRRMICLVGSFCCWHYYHMNLVEWMIDYASHTYGIIQHVIKHSYSATILRWQCNMGMDIDT